MTKPMPSGGGSYTRAKNGALKLQQNPTKPAEIAKPATQPASEKDA